MDGRCSAGLTCLLVLLAGFSCWSRLAGISSGSVSQTAAPDDARPAAASRACRPAHAALLHRSCCCRLGPTPHTTWLTFEVDFAFKSPLYRQVASIFFEEVRLSK